MTLTLKDIHDIETKYLKQDHDSHHQLAASINQHPDQQPCSPSAPVPPETTKNCELELRSSKIMPTIHY